MKIPPADALHLLHTARHATLATHASQLPGYPYATVLPCVVDAAQRPLLCVSALAEHTRNLLADGRCSLSVLQPDTADVLAAPRLSLIGDAAVIEPDAATLARYLRYQPEAERYLHLDFMFFRIQPLRVRYIGGFGAMGWLETRDWQALPTLAPEEEAVMLESLAAGLPTGWRLLGLDACGVDCLRDDIRMRLRFATMQTTPEAIAAAAALSLRAATY